jgi:hypothetical protein
MMLFSIEGNPDDPMGRSVVSHDVTEDPSDVGAFLSANHPDSTWCVKKQVHGKSAAASLSVWTILCADFPNVSGRIPCGLLS